MLIAYLEARTNETRQSRRQRGRTILKQADALAARGLGPALGLDALATIAAACRLDLEDRERGARDAATRILSLFDATLRADPPRDPTACRKGCSHCCRSIVSATAPEVFLIAARLRERMAAGTSRIEELERRLAVTAGLGRPERFGKKLACALLSEEACSVYRQRPLACRQVLSFDVAPCLEELEGLEGEFSVPAKPLKHAGNCGLALLAALLASGRPTERYELSAALAAALADPRSEARWLAGENVLAGVKTLDPWPAPLQTAAARLAERIEG